MSWVCSSARKERCISNHALFRVPSKYRATTEHHVVKKQLLHVKENCGTLHMDCHIVLPEKRSNRQLTYAPVSHLAYDVGADDSLLLSFFPHISTPWSSLACNFLSHLAVECQVASWANFKQPSMLFQPVVEATACQVCPIYINMPSHRRNVIIQFLWHTFNSDVLLGANRQPGATALHSAEPRKMPGALITTETRQHAPHSS